MANLNFKYGVYANLENAVFNPGTIYVTTDEKALYVDLPNGSNKDTDRIRIGQTVVYETAEAFLAAAKQPAFDTGAFYYIADANMLLRWNGGSKDIDVDGNGQIVPGKEEGWVQINSVSELEGDISDLEEAVEDIVKKIGNVDEGTNLADLIANEVEARENDVKAINDKIGNLGDGKTVEGLIGEINGTLTDHNDLIEGLGTAVEGIGDKIGSLGDGNTVESLIDGLTGDISDIKTVLGEIPEGENVADLIKAVDDKVGDIADGTTVKDLIEGLSGDIDGLGDQIEAIGGKFGDLGEGNTVESLISEVDAKFGNLGEGNTVKDLIDEIKDDIIGDVSGDTKTIRELIADAQNKADSAHGLAEDNQGAIEDIVAALDGAEGVKGKLESLQAAVESAQGKANDAYDLAEDANELATTANGTADEALALANTNKEAIQAIETVIGKPVEGAKSLVEQIADNRAAIDTKVDQEAYNAKVTELGSNISAAQGTADAAAAQAGENKTAIEQLSNTVVKKADYDAKVQELTGNITAAQGAANAAQVAADKAQGTADAAAKQAGENKTAIEDLGKVVEGNTKNINNLTTLVGTLPETAPEGSTVVSYIVSQMNAMNAMAFKDGVESPAGLPTTGVRVGDTYIVTSDSYGDNKFAGDLLVATGDEDETGYIVSNLAWTHVNTGYQASQENKLVKEDNKVVLKTYTGASLGSVAFTSENLNVDVTTVADTNDTTVDISLQWGQF